MDSTSEYDSWGNGVEFKALCLRMWVAVCKTLNHRVVLMCSAMFSFAEIPSAGNKAAHARNIVAYCGYFVSVD